MKFDIVWEDCIQEEARVANKEALLKEDDQALATHTKGRKQSNLKKDTRSIDLRRSFRRKKITVRRETTPNINVTIIIR